MEKCRLRLSFVLLITFSCSLLSSPADTTTIPTRFIDLIPDLLRAQYESFTEFEAKYTFTAKALPGFYEFLKKTSNPTVPFKSKDGFNEKFHVVYKKSGDGFQMNVIHNDDGVLDAYDYHSDGKLNWYQSERDKTVVLTDDFNVLPPFFDKFLKYFPTHSPEKFRILKIQNSCSLLSLLEGGNNKIEFQKLSEGGYSVLFLSPSRRDNSPGLYDVRKIFVQDSPSFRIIEYDYLELYRLNGSEHEFKPRYTVKFDDFKIMGGTQVPYSIKVTSFYDLAYGHDLTLSDRIKYEDMVPAMEWQVTLESIDLHPKFTPGEFSFSYPKGTRVVDTIAHRVYFTGETLSQLPKTIDQK